MTANDSAPEATGKDLIVARRRADVTVNGALEWVERFCKNTDPDIIVRVISGVRSLVESMQGRSAVVIEARVDDLLAVQARLRLGGTISEVPRSTSLEANRLFARPRIHSPWSISEYFASERHDHRPLKQMAAPVFISYARADLAWLERLKIHLRPLERAKRLDLWHDGRIEAGKPWINEIARALQAASSAILLLSPDFMASDFIYTRELQPLAERALSGGVVIFPLIVGHCLFEEDPYLKDFQLFNDPELPLSRLDSSEADRVLVRLAKAVLRLSSVPQS